MTTTQTDRLSGVLGNTAIKTPVAVATTAAITLSGEQTIDGVLTSSSRVLVKNQASAIDNGIYLSDTGAWERTQDFDGSRDVVEGTLVKVNGGSTTVGFWYVTTTGSPVPGTDAINFGQASTVLAVVTAYAQGLLAAVNAAAARTVLGLGSAALSAASAFVASAVAYTASTLTMSTSRLLGRTTASSGAAEEISVSSPLTLTGGALGYTATAASALAGSIVQNVSTQTGAVATGTTVIPVDDTIPQITEGDQYMTLAITPTSATNALEITVVVNLAHSADGNLCAALFQDATAGALAAAKVSAGAANSMTQVIVVHRMTAGTTSSTTFRVRAGSSGAGTTTFNGQSGARIFGGVAASSITIREIKV